MVSHRPSLEHFNVPETADGPLAPLPSVKSTTADLPIPERGAEEERQHATADARRRVGGPLEVAPDELEVLRGVQFYSLSAVRFCRNTTKNIYRKETFRVNLDQKSHSS